MSEGFILLFDDDKDIVKNFGTVIPQTGTKLKFNGFSDVNKFRDVLQDVSTMKQTKVLIFDLAKDKKEEVQLSFEIKGDIIKNFNEYRIPIFIHSAYYDHFKDLDGRGTVFKIDKGKDSIQIICERIKLMEESGFLDILSPDGILEKELLGELHNSFTKQFRGDEIEKIINSIKGSAEGDYKKRVKEVFKRIALRSLIHNLMCPEHDNGTIKEIGLHLIEHCYRRMSKYKVWTGDIFRKKDGTESLFIITPRCDITKADCSQILVCKILPYDNNPSKKEIIDATRDNPTKTGYRYRILLKTPLFEGGKVDFYSHFTIKKDKLLSYYERVVTLSDELSNDVVRKFCSYILRSGVSETEIEETARYLEILSKK